MLSMGSHRVRHNRSDLTCMHALEKEMATHSSILAWKIPGQRLCPLSHQALVGCCLWGRTELDMTEATSSSSSSQSYGFSSSLVCM